jgi:hypothetical protein
MSHESRKLKQKEKKQTNEGGILLWPCGIEAVVSFPLGFSEEFPTKQKPVFQAQINKTLYL